MPPMHRFIRAGLSTASRLLQKGDKDDTPTFAPTNTPAPVDTPAPTTDTLLPTLQPTTIDENTANIGACGLQEPDCCNGDFDCQGNMICIEVAVWSDDERFCECSLWYGWNGPDCTDYGVTSYILLFAVVIASIYLVTLLFRIFFSLRGVMKKQHDRGDSVLDATITMIFTTLGTAFLLTWRIMELINLFTPLDHVVAQEEGDSLNQFGSPAKLQKLVVETRFMVLLMGVFVVLATLNVFLIWIQQNSGNFTEKYRSLAWKVVRGTQALFCVGVLIVIVAGRLEIIAGFALVLLGIIGVVYWRFKRVHGKHLNEKTLYYVRGVFATLILETLFTFLYSIFFVLGWKQYNPKDVPSSFVLLNEGMIYSICGTLGFMYSQSNYVLYHKTLNWKEAAERFNGRISAFSADVFEHYTRHGDNGSNQAAGKRQPVTPITAGRNIEY